jgi:hypothetical protein
MITIFGEFCQFSAFFSKKYNVMIKFVRKLAVVLAKNNCFFAKCFGENTSKNIRLVPGTYIQVMTVSLCLNAKKDPT